MRAAVRSSICSGPVTASGTGPGSRSRIPGTASCTSAASSWRSRATVPAMAEPRPVALPPAERTVGQLVAESVRFYGDHFWGVLWLGLAPATLAVVGANVSRRTALVLSPTLLRALLSATYVYASMLVLGRRPARLRLAVARLAGWVGFAPLPLLPPALALSGPA